MDFIIDAIVEWLKGLLVDGIMGNLDGLFDNVNQSVGEIATQVGTTPADWNAGVFSMIRQISETAILPIAGVILTFVMTYELIQIHRLSCPVCRCVATDGKGRENTRAERTDGKGRENTRAERNDRRDHSTADTSGNRETGAASGNRKERNGNAGN